MIYNKKLDILMVIIVYVKINGLNSPFPHLSTASVTFTVIVKNITEISKIVTEKITLIKKFENCNEKM